MKKKSRVALVAVVALFAIAGTLAYFSASGTFDNKFNTADFSNDIYELFNPNDAKDLTPGATVNKDVMVTNDGEIPVLARVKYTETGSDAMKAAMLKTYCEGWILGEDGYYYYNGVVAAGDTVQHLDSVQLDKNYTGSATTDYYYTTDADPTADSTWVLMTATQKADYIANQSFKDDTGATVNFTGIKQKTSKAGEDYTLTVEVETIQAKGISADDLTAAWGSKVPAVIQALVPVA